MVHVSVAGCVAPQEQKNREAVAVLQRVLRGATWTNVHSLPREDGSSLQVFETREAAGHGARWELLLGDKGKYFFRGFLEPQMADGHEKGWRH